MKIISYFDCNCVIGRRMIRNPYSFYKKDDLLKKMKRYGIDKALVYHSMAREYSPSVGNQMLIDEIKNDPALEGVWVVLPHHTGEFPDPSELRKSMKENNIKAVRMFPSSKDHRYPLCELFCGELFDMLEECRVPLFIDYNQLTIDELNSILSAHPFMRIILTDLHYNVGRSLYPILKKYEHLYLETIGYKLFGGTEEFCRIFGAGRLIFGSGAPLYSGAAAVGMLSYARISHEEKCMIASENLNMLLGGVKL